VHAAFVLDIILSHAKYGGFGTNLGIRADRIGNAGAYPEDVDDWHCTLVRTREGLFEPTVCEATAELLTPLILLVVTTGTAVPKVALESSRRTQKS
jgi:hypothetical protein